MDIKKIINKKSREYKHNLKKIAENIRGFIEQADAAANVDKIFQENEIYKQLQDINNNILDYVVDAACVNIHISVNRTLLSQKLSLPWAKDKLSLSQRLYSLTQTQYSVIKNTIAGELARGTELKRLSLELYDGYRYGNRIPVAQLPKYLQKIIKKSAKDADIRAAAKNIENLSANGAPTRPLKAAYKQLYNASVAASDKNLTAAIYTAVNEKSRYLADRIVRTEMARAYTDGTIAETLADDDVIGYTIKASSRHCEDICDNCIGKLYRKDNIPRVPIHPQCMDMIVPVYRGDTRGRKFSSAVNGVAFENPYNTCRITADDLK